MSKTLERLPVLCYGCSSRGSIGTRRRDFRPVFFLLPDLSQVDGTAIAQDISVERCVAFVLRDRDRIFGYEFVQQLTAMGVAICLDHVIVFNEAVGSSVAETTTGTSYPQLDELSETQRRVLIALCRPQLAEGALYAPASNQQIAEEVYLSVDTVKTTLRAMFGKYGLDELPQNQKRAGLAEFAVRVGLVTSRDL